MVVLKNTVEKTNKQVRPQLKLHLLAVAWVTHPERQLAVLVVAAAWQWPPLTPLFYV